MMERKEIKARARAQIKGNIGMLFLIALIIGLITTAVSAPLTALSFVMPFLGSLGSIVTILIAAPFALSMAFIYKNLSEGKKASIEHAFYGFKDYTRALAAYFLQGLYLGLWFLIPLAGIVIMIVKSFSYSMTYYILLDNPQLSAGEAITESRRIMNGNKFRLFVQDLSFLGWMLLSVLTLGILMIWVEPYMQAARYNLYLDIRGNNNEEAPQPIEGQIA